MSILPLAALTACAGDAKPVLVAPEIEEARKSCAAYPEITNVLENLPEHVFLAGADGSAVITDGDHTWVRFDVVNAREAILIRFAEVDGRTAHFECFDDLRVVIDILDDLPTVADLP